MLRSIPSIREFGSAVLYGAGKILVIGGRAQSAPADPQQATNTAELVNLYDNPPLWRATGSMARGRKYMNATVLPDGRVLATGGTSADCADETNEDPSVAVLDAEIWNPSTELWTYAGTISEARLYHSVGFLLPDGTVVIGGGGEGGVACSGQGQFASHLTAQIYSPNYLFRGGTRPVIGSILNSDSQTEVGYNSSLTFAVQSDNSISRVTLIRLPSVTHSFNQNQWFYEMQISAQDGGSVTVQTPSRWEELPPGHYMMFALDQNGVPSVSKIMRFRDPNVPWHNQ